MREHIRRIPEDLFRLRRAGAYHGRQGFVVRDSLGSREAFLPFRLQELALTYLSVPNWHRYQHYRDRTPVWVKLYVESINDAKLRSLSLEARLVWHEMLKLAATFQNAVPNSPEVCANLAGIPTGIWREACEELIRKRLLRVKQTRRGASKSASRDASLEVRSKSKRKNAREEPSAQEPNTCPECDLGGGNHAADCTKRLRVA